MSELGRRNFDIALDAHAAVIDGLPWSATLEEACKVVNRVNRALDDAYDEARDSRLWTRRAAARRAMEHAFQRLERVLASKYAVACVEPRRQDAVAAQQWTALAFPSR